MASFSLDVARFVSEFKESATLIVRKVAIDAFSRVILKTPVDTGRARANWQCAIGEVPQSSLLLNDKEGTATVDRVTAEAMKLKVGDTIYLINNVVYILALEHGHSKQAPAGMVEITVREFQTILDQAAPGMTA
jgi:hypothetical protein